MSPGHTTAPRSSWNVGTDAEAIHALLCRSDDHHAAAYGLPVPARRLEKTRQLVAAGDVQVLEIAGDILAMFTLTEEPPFKLRPSMFASATRPMYLQRLVVAPQWLDRMPTLGLRSLRRAAELSVSRGADALRAEANPDLKASMALLLTFGFTRQGPEQSENDLRRVYLQKHLTP